MKIQLDSQEVRHLEELLTDSITCLESKDIFNALESLYSARAFMQTKFSMLDDLETDFGAMD